MATSWSARERPEPTASISWGRWVPPPHGAQSCTPLPKKNSPIVSKIGKFYNFPLCKEWRHWWVPSVAVMATHAAFAPVPQPQVSCDTSGDIGSEPSVPGDPWGPAWQPLPSCSQPYNPLWPSEHPETWVLKSMGRGVTALVLARGSKCVSDGRVLGWQVSVQAVSLPSARLLTCCFLFLGSFKFLLYSQQPRKSDPFC